MKYLFVVGWLATQCLSLSAQDLSLYEKRTYKNNAGEELPYRVLLPKDYDKTKKYPLVLFLHGAGERGNDNEAQLTHGARLFLSDENRQKYPAIVIFPQCPKESFWSSVSFDRSTTPVKFTFDYSKPMMSPLASVMAVVDQIVSEEGVDKSRMYIAGLSMGGMGTFELLYHYPNMFAAAMPICGGGDVKSYDKRVKNISFWVFHGDQDAVVNPKYSREMVAKLKEIKADVMYTEYPGVNHNSWDNAFAEPTFMSWMFGYKKK
ncbi:MAG TPA: prolyl oligopeptidase family serine peptidase [Cyclobacteriaceae bacterium]|nr:prolyl oligopeptidase family serine peptidase [Cyclobacteriaceae bacterium]